jgi:DNA-binding transcriptional MerR regulator
MNKLEHLDKLIALGKKQMRFSEEHAWLAHLDDPIDADQDGVILAFNFAETYHKLQRTFRNLESFSLRHMAMAAGAAPICVESWERKGVITTTAHRGYGKRKKYGFGDLVAVFVIAALRRRGVSLNTCRAVYRLIAGTSAQAIEAPVQDQRGADRQDDQVTLQESTESRC